MTNLPITQVAITDISDLLNPQGGRRMNMPGFDAEFVDFPDYIVRITNRIWHDRDVDLIHRYYAPDCTIHTQGGDIVGAQAVMDNTRNTMTAFPDRTLDADNVIWSKDGNVFYSSHLITSRMTNLGSSEFGPPTGRSARVRTIADCTAGNNFIFEEWLVRDQAAIVEQLGFDVDTKARVLAQADIDAGFDLLSFHEEKHQNTYSHQYGNIGKPDDPECEVKTFIESLFKNLWNVRQSDKRGDYYDFRVSARYPGARDFYGHDQVASFIHMIFGTLPDAVVKIEHIADIPYLGRARDVAVRWSLAGYHTGDGFYGEATRAPVYIMGISHFRLVNGRVREEVTLWDDVAVRRMIEGVRLRG
ncbi:MAG: ester cyclase [Hyphomonadaceae bacterium]|nr:ester cyclase [Hyphomonadaceae bacterium]